MISDGVRHLAFAMHFALVQARGGRYFIFEHPMTAKSWETKTLEALRQAPGYIEVEFDFCTMGMVSSDNEGEAPVKKRTRIGTNCPAVAEALAVMQCAGGHRHVQHLQGRASACQQYPV